MDYESNEELYFSWWMDDLIASDVIIDYKYEPYTFTLSKNTGYPIRRIKKTKSKIDRLTLLQEHVYTPDFMIQWNPNVRNKIYRLIDDDTCTSKPPFFAIKSLKDGKDYTLVEVKPVFDQNNMTRLFRLNQKWMYDKFKAYVEQVTVPTIFKSTFTPERYRYTDKARQLRKINFEVKTIIQYLNILHI